MNVYLVWVLKEDKEKIMVGCYATEELARLEQSKLEDSCLYVYVSVSCITVIGG